MKLPGCQDVVGGASGKTSLLGNSQQDVLRGKIQAIDKVRLKQLVMNRPATRLSIRPCRQLLSEAAVVSVSPFPVWQPFVSHQSGHALLSGRYVNVPSGEEFFERQSFIRRLRVQRKMPKPNLDIIDSLESFNTDRTEIAPRSDVVREDFQSHFRLVGHEASFAAVLVVKIRIEPQDFHGARGAVILIVSRRGV